MRSSWSSAAREEPPHDYHDRAGQPKGRRQPGGLRALGARVLRTGSKGTPLRGRLARLQVTGLLASDAAPPYRYVVTLEVGDLDQLGRDMAGAKMQRLLPELHRFAEVTQLKFERFA